MDIKTNKDTLMKQVLIGKIAPPSLSSSDPRGGYVTTWDGRAKLGLGPGGIKYNIKIGDPCLGWPESEYLEPGVSLMGLDDGPSTPRSTSGTSIAFLKLSNVANKVTIISGDGKGSIGIITGKGGIGVTSSHLQSWFPTESLEKMCTGDRVKVVSEGVGLAIEGWEGRLFNTSPKLLESLNPKLSDGILELPVSKIIPIHAMGIGVGGSSPETGGWCIQSNPPHLVEDLGIKNLRFGDLIAIKDALMHYGKGYYRGAITIGIITTGGSEVAGQGPSVMAIAASKKGFIKTRVEPDANLVKFLELR
ncbi:DUF4438 domain-containing protein [Candidatus Bathyarchaeota archaeon]|nr:DUF4438 domain-containing protein [Candidatus Bathyarchaeota archaeon]